MADCLKLKKKKKTQHLVYLFKVIFNGANITASRGWNQPQIPSQQTDHLDENKHRILTADMVIHMEIYMTFCPCLGGGGFALAKGRWCNMGVLSTYWSGRLSGIPVYTGILLSLGNLKSVILLTTNELGL